MKDSSKCMVNGRMIYLFENNRCRLEGSEYTELVEQLDSMLYSPEHVRIHVLKYSRSGIVFEESSLEKPPVYPVRIVDKGVRYYALIKTENYIGFIGVGGYNIVILPKFYDTDMDLGKALGLLLSMINRILSPSVKIEKILALIDEAHVSLGWIKDYSILMELLGLQYVYMLYGELRRGIYREYRVIESEEKYLRGKLLLSRQARKPPHRLDSFSVRLHLLSGNNLLNQTLYYASLLVYRKSRIVEAVRRAKWIMEILREAETRENPLLHGKPVFHRLNSRFYNPYILASMIIEGLGRWPRERIHGFLADMNMLFQYYIYSIIKQYYPAARAEPRIGYLLKEDSRNMRIVSEIPDIVIYEGGKPVMVIDVKYKKLDRLPGEERSIRTAITDDLRQVYVYSRLARKRSGKAYRGSILVYITSRDGKHDIRKYNYIVDNDEEPLYIIRFNTTYLLEDPIRAEKELIELLRNIIG